jgi:dipeptidyl aminopeptidase/acylaminoacyl peptidase
VLQVNPRGSGSYGEAFARAVIRDWGGADWEDIVAVLDSVLADEAAGIDPARTALTGGSYGGFMTCWAITQTDRFAVALAGAPLTNLESMYGTADIGPSWFADEIGGTPLDAYDRFRSRSALPLAARVRTPLLLYHGEADLRVPIEQSEQFFTALTALGHDVELLRVPAEGHVLPSDASPVHRRIVRETILEWLDRYLRPSGAKMVRRRSSAPN